MIKKMHDHLWEVVKILAMANPYASSSDYYAHKDAAEILSSGLPDSYQKSFMSYINKKIKGLSNYAGD